MILLLPFRRWLIGALVLPVVIWLMDRFTDAWCERQGDGFVVGRVRWVARWLSKYETGPLSHDDRTADAAR